MFFSAVVKFQAICVWTPDTASCNESHQYLSGALLTILNSFVDANFLISLSKKLLTL